MTVGVVALPLALAFGISSGVGAAAGLITAVIAGLVAAVFGGSHVQVSGPTGAMAVVLAPIVVLHGVGSVALVTMLAGLIVLAAGVTGPGRAVTFVALLMVVLPRLNRSIPESLTAVVAATVVVFALRIPVAAIGELPSHLPAPVLPHADSAPSGTSSAPRWPSRRWRRSSRCCPRGSQQRWRPRTPTAERISTAILDAEHRRTSVVIIRMSQLGMLDATGAHTLAQICGELEGRGITVIIKGVRPEHNALLANVGVFESLRHERHLVDTLDEAIEHARTHVSHQPH